MKHIINDKTLAVLPVDKYTLYVIIKKRVDSIAKIKIIIDDGVTCGVYTPTTNNTMKDLKYFLEFLYRNFKDHPKYEKLLST